jgi:hypothetical protein
MQRLFPPFFFPLRHGYKQTNDATFRVSPGGYLVNAVAPSLAPLFDAFMRRRAPLESVLPRLTAAFYAQFSRCSASAFVTFSCVLFYAAL